MEKCKYYKPLERSLQISALHEAGLSKGSLVGFDGFDASYSFKMGSTTYIMGAPASGKSEFIFECLLNMAEKYGHKSVIFSPETGTVDEIIAELISKYARKHFYRNYLDHITELELYNALTWVNEHFYIIDVKDEDLTFADFYALVDEIEMNEACKIDFTMIDPFNEIKHDFSEDNGRQDLYIERMLGFIRKNARNKNRHNIIVTHCKDQVPIFDTETKQYYYPPPTARDYAGGQAWFRKGLGMLGMWRPLKGMNDINGEPYKENEVYITVQKAKPKGIGKVSKVKLFYNFHANRYYDIINGIDVYAHKTDVKGNKLHIEDLPKIVWNKQDEAPF